MAKPGSSAAAAIATGAAVDLNALRKKVTVEQLIIASINEACQTKPSREASLTVTKLEEALMWHRQDVLIKTTEDPNASS